MVLKVQGRTDNAPEEMKDDAATVEHVEQPVEEAGASAAETVATAEVVVDEAVAEAEPEAQATAQAEVVVEEEAEAASAARSGEVVDDAGNQEAAAEAKPVESVTQQVAVRNESTAVAIPREPGAAENFFKNMIDQLIGDGQEGLEMGYGVFPVISLDKGEFKVGDEDVGDDEFEGVPLMSKPKFAFTPVSATGLKPFFFAASRSLSKS